MKIYTRLKIDMETGQTVEEESFEYSGPVALAIAWLPIIAGVGLAYSIYKGETSKDKKPGSYIPPHLEAFWKEFMASWFGMDGGIKFKDMIVQDIKYQKGVYGTFLTETKGYTKEYRDKLKNLEKTYTNRPYTFDFNILGQTVKNIPNRSLSIMQTLGELATKRHDAGMTQSGLVMQGGAFTPNRGQRDYIEQLMRFLQQAPGYSQPRQEDNSWWSKIDTATKWYDLFKNISGTWGSTPKVPINPQL